MGLMGVPRSTRWSTWPLGNFPERLDRRIVARPRRFAPSGKGRQHPHQGGSDAIPGSQVSQRAVLRWCRTLGAGNSGAVVRGTYGVIHPGPLLLRRPWMRRSPSVRSLSEQVLPVGLQAASPMGFNHKRKPDGGQERQMSLAGHRSAADQHRGPSGPWRRDAITTHTGRVNGVASEAVGRAVNVSSRSGWRKHAPMAVRNGLYDRLGQGFSRGKLQFSQVTNRERGQADQRDPAPAAWPSGVVRPVVVRMMINS